MKWLEVEQSGCSDEDRDILSKAYLVIKSNIEDVDDAYIERRLIQIYYSGIPLSRLILEASDGKCATPMVLRGARKELCLSADQMARVLETDHQTIRRMEQTPQASTFRKPAARMVRLIMAYLAGYRPEDWPIPSYNT